MDDEQDDGVIMWDTTASNFLLKLQRAGDRRTNVLFTTNPNITEHGIYIKYFPRILTFRTIECTNERYQILSKVKSKKLKRKVRIPLTDFGKIQIILGTMLIMSYNRLPQFHDYCCSKSLLGNNLIKEVISRNRFCLVFSELYFSSLKKARKCE